MAVEQGSADVIHADEGRRHHGRRPEGDRPGGKGGGETVTMYVATEGKPYVLRLDQSGGENPGTVVFSDYERPVEAAPPPTEQVIDAAKGDQAAS
ncbi:hypothetical protein SHL15_6549 [Streptomyces hygroscopicus subsp. limoneus]|nr:hypothetical protein SHL15_6549 [Streptomyces hygroscopicus subsp. limoneus]